MSTISSFPGYCSTVHNIQDIDLVCPPTDKWRRTYGILFSHKKDGIMSFVEPGDIISSEVSQAQRDKYSTFLLRYVS
jgi:hypothetical protein